MSIKFIEKIKLDNAQVHRKYTMITLKPHLVKMKIHNNGIAISHKLLFY